MRTPTWMLAGIAAMTLAACGTGGTSVAGQAQLSPVGEAAPVPEMDGEPVNCEERLAAGSDSASTAVVLAWKDDALLRRSLQAVTQTSERVLLVGSDARGATEVLVSADLSGQGGSEAYRQADAALRVRCFAALASRRATELPGEAGAALSALPSALAQGRQLARGGDVEVLVHQAGRMHESGLDLARADLGDQDGVATLLDDMRAGGLLDLDTEGLRRLAFVGVGDGADNGLIAAQRRDFFEALCERLEIDGSFSCDVVEEATS